MQSRIWTPCTFHLQLLDTGDPKTDAIFIKWKLLSDEFPRTVALHVPHVSVGRIHTELPCRPGHHQPLQTPTGIQLPQFHHSKIPRYWLVYLNLCLFRVLFLRN